MNEILKNGSTLRSGILFAFAVALCCYVAWILRDELVLLYVSALLAVVLRPLVLWVSHVRIGNRRPFRGVAILVLLVAMAGAFTALGFYAIPPVVRDLQHFTSEVPQGSPGLLAKAEQIPILHSMNTAALEEKIQNGASRVAAYLMSSAKELAGKVVSFVTTFILTIYFILEGDAAYHWFLTFFLPEDRDRLDRTLQRARMRMDRWLVGQGALMLILGCSSTVVFALLHLRYSYALGILAGLLNFIPVLGIAVSVGLALLVAAIDSWGKVLGVAIFFFIYLQIENTFLTPHIMKQRVGLPALAILVALLIGFALAGVMGSLVAVPTAVLVAELADEYLVRKELAV